MKENGELERDDIEIDCGITSNIGSAREIVCSIEAQFDVGKKFNIDFNKDDDMWINMCAWFNPFEDTLIIGCEVSEDDSSYFFEYKPTENEANMIKGKISEKMQALFGQTPQEFCNEIFGKEQTMGEIK